MSRDLLDELARRGLRNMSPAKVGAVLSALGEQVRKLDPVVLARHDVRPAAAELHAVLGVALGAVEPLSEYETHRADAREIRDHLAWAVAALKSKADRGEEIDLEALRAYEDELREQTGVTT